MFLIDSLFSYRSSEPIWFRYFRSVFAIVLTVILLYYSRIQLEKINTQYTTTRLQQIEKFHFDVNICTGISNNCSSFPGLHDFDFSTNTNTIDYIWLNRTTPNISNVMPIFLSFESVELHFKRRQITFNKRFNDNTIEDFSDLSQYSYIIEQTRLSIYPGQAIIITLKPIIAYYNIYYRAANGFVSNTYQLELNPQIKPLPTRPAVDEFQVGVFTRSDFIKVEDIKTYDYTDFLSNVGGFYSTIVATFILLFGMDKHGPWGLFQKYILFCVPCYRSFARNFAREYVSAGGIPFSEKVKERPKSSPLESFEERVQILETLLRDYYLDDFYLERVKKIKTHQESLRNEKII